MLLTLLATLAVSAAIVHPEPESSRAPDARAAAPAHRALDDEFTAPRNVTVNAGGARLVRIDARAGSLKVTGRAGISEARVRGTARASHERFLEEIRLRAQRQGDVVEIVVDIPDRNFSGFGSFHRALDLEIEIPAGIAVQIEDTSGDVEVSGTGAVDIDDNSGDVSIVDAGGTVRVEDGSGDLEIERARGSVTVRDGSGDIEIRGVAGSVDVEGDGSGEIVASGVTGSVRVGSDGSGSIRVEDVGGAFIVERDGSGGIEHANVRGAVQLPTSRGKRPRPDY